MLNNMGGIKKDCSSRVVGVLDSSLQSQGRGDKSFRTISSAQQEKIDAILRQMKCSTERMEHLLAVFNRMNRGA